MNRRQLTGSLVVAAALAAGVPALSYGADNAATASENRAKEIMASVAHAGGTSGGAAYARGTSGGVAHAGGTSGDDAYAGYSYNYDSYPGYQQLKSSFTLTAYTPEGKARDLNEVQYGDTLVIEGTNRDNEVRHFSVEIHSNVVPLGQHTVQPGKGINVKYTVNKKDLEPGDHWVYNTSLDRKGDRSRAKFTIPSKQKGKSPKKFNGTLRKTGSAVMGIALVAAVATGAGATLVAVRRRKA